MGLDVGVLEQKLFHLFLEILARTRVSEIEAVFIDKPCLDAKPFLPGFLGDGLPDPRAKLSRVGRKIEPLSFFF